MTAPYKPNSGRPDIDDMITRHIAALDIIQQSSDRIFHRLLDQAIASGHIKPGKPLTFSPPVSQSR